MWAQVTDVAGKSRSTKQRRSKTEGVGGCGDGTGEWSCGVSRG